MTEELKTGDCLKILDDFKDNSFDLIYLDPPFFTGKVQKLKTKDRTKEYAYKDIWKCDLEYADFLFQRIRKLKRVLKNTGSIFVHCDRNATHIIRAILDDIFGKEQFRSEIIWYYKRWSNSKKGLLPSHQTIYFYSKSDDFKFNTIYTEYAEATNIEQILQKRTRDAHGKVIYARDEKGSIILDDEKKGVPLRDVWEIPFLNPKAKERAGYPTQKPVMLLQRIIEIVTREGDLVLDPFCGCGSTLVASKLEKRNSIGIDISEEAIALTKKRLSDPIETKSKTDRGKFDKNISDFLRGVDYIPVQRNKMIDAILKQQYKETPVPIRVQRKGESLEVLARSLFKVAQKKCFLKAIIIRTQKGEVCLNEEIRATVSVVNAVALSVSSEIE